MSLLRSIFQLILIVASQTIFAQTTATLSGYIRDAESGENLIGATIVDRGSGKGTITNAYGFFSLTLPKGEIELTISYVGYQLKSESLTFNSDEIMVIKLKLGQELDELVVVGDEEDRFLLPQMSTIKMSVEQINQLPATMGERDIMKSIQLLPGISGGAEGSSTINVRGGGNDQNLTLLDGVPLYNPSHLYGFFSVFNPDAINNIEVIKGGFPARYGGRLSSIIDVSMKEGSDQKLRGSAMVGPLAASLSLEGPIKKDQTSFILSGRRSYIGLIYNPFDNFGSEFDIASNYYFYDFNAKINHRFSTRSRLFLSMYTGFDDFFDQAERTNEIVNQKTSTSRESVMQWGNSMAVARWNYLINPRLFLNVSLSTNGFRFRTEKEYQTTIVENNVTTKELDYVLYKNRIKDYTSKIDLEYFPSTIHSIKAGVSMIHHDYAPGVYRIDQEVTGNEQRAGAESITSMEYAFYAEDDIQITRLFRVNLGVHQSLFSVQGTTYSSTQPRISSIYNIGNGLSAKASYATMQQYNHLLTNSGIGLPTDLWVPATSGVKPQSSQQFALGLFQRFGNYEISVEAYTKQMKNLIEYQEGASYTGGQRSWYDLVTTGDGTSKGMEFLFRKNEGKLTGWLAYTLSKTDRQFDELNEGKTFPYRYDRRHDVSVVTNYKFNKSWATSVVWVFSSGHRLTLLEGGHPVGFPSSQQYATYNYTERNAVTASAYHRLDFSVSWHKEGIKVGHEVSAGIFNVYGRENAFYYDLFPEVEKNILVYDSKSLLPTIPYLNYKIAF